MPRSRDIAIFVLTTTTTTRPITLLPNCACVRGNELPKVFVHSIQGPLKLKWRDYLNHEAAFCYQKFPVSLNLTLGFGLYNEV